MITGFNTDVKHKSKVYHVQTEDKGRENPKIETLVYLGGQILDSYRIPYQTDPPLEEAAISEIMEAQHKRIIRNIRIGKFDDPEEDTWELGNLSLDEAVLQYLSDQQSSDKIEIQMSGLEKLNPVSPAILQFFVKCVSTEKPIERARIRVKLMCHQSAPLLLSQGETSSEGKLDLSVTVNEKAFKQKCLIKIQVFSETGNAESKFALPT